MKIRIDRDNSDNHAVFAIFRNRLLGLASAGKISILKDMPHYVEIYCDVGALGDLLK